MSSAEWGLGSFYRSTKVAALTSDWLRHFHFLPYVLVSSRLPSSTRYGAEAEPRGHIEVERGDAVN